MKRPPRFTDTQIEVLQKILQGDIKDFIIAARIGVDDRVFFNGAYSSLFGLLEISDDLVHEAYARSIEEAGD